MSYTHTHTHTDRKRDLHTKRLTHKLGALLLPKKKSKNKNKMIQHDMFLCAVKPKKKERKTETILTSLLFLSVVFSMKDY